MKKLNKIAFVGEAMLELVNADKNTLRKSFAGDAYNSSVYLKRAFPQFDVAFMTAVGSDILSHSFTTALREESINDRFIGHTDGKHMGAYMVLNDDTGERSFLYWRNDSAAKSMMTSFSDEQMHAPFDVIFFSGITLAILNTEQRSLFFKYIEKAKAAGSLIIFDPNYRAKLWESEVIAKENLQTAFEVSDWLMPGVDDFAKLYGLTDVESCLAFCEQFNFKELVMKQGEKAVHVINGEGTYVVKIKPSTNVVDTTSAGDAFNGIYIGARLGGASVNYATELAGYAAKQVIETAGAIMPKEKFDTTWAQKPQEKA